MNTLFEVVTLTWALTSGQYFDKAIAFGPEFQSASPYFVTTEFEFQIPMSWTKGGKDQFFLGTSTQNEFFPMGQSVYLVPWQDTYTFNGGVRLWGIEVGYEHQCSHPVKTQGFSDSVLYSAYDKVYFKIEGKI